MRIQSNARFQTAQVIQRKLTYTKGGFGQDSWQPMFCGQWRNEEARTAWHKIETAYEEVVKKIAQIKQEKNVKHVAGIEDELKELEKTPVPYGQRVKVLSDLTALGVKADNELAAALKRAAEELLAAQERARVAEEKRLAAIEKEKVDRAKSLEKQKKEDEANKFKQQQLQQQQLQQQQLNQQTNQVKPAPAPVTVKQGPSRREKKEANRKLEEDKRKPEDEREEKIRKKYDPLTNKLNIKKASSIIEAALKNLEETENSVERKLKEALAEQQQPNLEQWVKFLRMEHYKLVNAEKYLNLAVHVTCSSDQVTAPATMVGKDVNALVATLLGSVDRASRIHATLEVKDPKPHYFWGDPLPLDDDRKHLKKVLDHYVETRIKNLVLTAIEKKGDI